MLSEKSHSLSERKNGSFLEEICLRMKKNVLRAIVEIGFITFLFYSNLLMGEFERSGMGRQKGWAWALGDVLTTSNFEIAMIAALMGYVIFGVSS